MAQKKGEKIKLVLVTALSLVLLFSFYFRFIHAKVKATEMDSSSASPSGSGMASSSPLAILKKLPIPKGIPADLQRLPDYNPAIPDDLHTVIRDIFLPLASNSKPATGVEAVVKEQAPPIPKPPPSFKLRGTVVGKETSMAIIDDQFLRQGDWIGEFRVAEIRKKDVLLESGDQKIVLEILKNE